MEFTWFERDIGCGLTISVTTNLSPLFGIELIIVEKGSPRESLTSILGLLTYMQTKYPPNVLKEYHLTMHNEDPDNNRRSHLFLDVDKTASIKDLLASAGLPNNTEIRQYHPPLPLEINEETMSHFPGYFPLKSLRNVPIIAKDDYRLHLH